eukprot:Sdes_comp20565_c0_seq1m15431
MFEDTFLTRPPTPVPFSCGFPRKHSKFMLCIPPPSSAAPSSSTPQFHQPQPSSSHPEPAQLSSAQSPSEDASLATSPPPSSSMYKECLKSLQESQDFSSLYDMVVEASKKHKAGPEFLTEQFVSSAIDLGEDDFQFFQTCSEEVLSAELFLQGFSFLLPLLLLASFSHSFFPCRMVVSEIVCHFSQQNEQKKYLPPCRCFIEGNAEKTLFLS